MKESVVKKIKSLLTVNFLLYVIVSVCIIVAIAGCIDRAFFYRISNGSSNTSFIMENEVEYAQKIKSNGDELKSLALTFGTFQQEKQGKIEISIKDAKGNILQRWEIDAASVQDNTIREFGVDKPVLLSETIKLLSMQQLTVEVLWLVILVLIILPSISI